MLDLKDRNITKYICKPAVNLIRSIYGSGVFPLYRPTFEGNEKSNLFDYIDSNFVSTAGAKVDEFEQLISNYTRSKYAIATINGASALHISLLLSDVEASDEKY